MPITAKKKLGNLGETISANYLKHKGYQIVELNYTNPSGRRLGEIDIIAKDSNKNELVFVEVKARNFQKYFHTLPEENVNYQKIRRMEKIAYFYLQQQKIINQPYRFDVISIWIDNVKRNAKIKHIKAI